MNEPQILSVSDLNALSRQLLEGSFPNIKVEGEISNFVVPASGHWYFTLKDDKAQIRCAMFKGHNARVATLPSNGDQVIISAKVSLYEGRGDYQLIASQMENVGDGALRRAFDLLKAKLFKQGFFDEDHKKPIPENVKTIGVITSSTGAAVRDILSTLNRRSPQTNVIIYPCMVQGAEAAREIIRAIETANQRQECDVLIVARGGGSLEDLWCFNDEALAQTIYLSELPIMSGVGHEIDFTITDFVADHRAATPTAAAEFVSSDQQHVKNQLQQTLVHLNHIIQLKIQRAQQSVLQLSKRLQQLHPKQKLQQQAQHLDYLTQNLHSRMQTLLEQQRAKLSKAAATLNALSPLQTLSRGYSITLKDNKPVTDVENVANGDTIHTKLTNGEIISIVKK